jgi:WD40 repeat protein
MRSSIAAVCLGVWLLLDALAFADEPSPDAAPPLPVVAAAFSPDGKLLAAGFGGREAGGGGLLLWNVDQKQAVRVTRYERRVTSVAFSPDSRQLAYSITVSARDRRRDGGPRSRRSKRAAAAQSPFGRPALATSSDDKTIHLWDVAKAADRHVLVAAKDVIYGPLRFSPDGKLLVASRGSDGIHVLPSARANQNTSCGTAVPSCGEQPVSR